MTLERICEALKELGVKEIILEIDNEVPAIYFHGEEPAIRNEFYRVVATNADFAEHGL